MFALGFHFLTGVPHEAVLIGVRRTGWRARPIRGKEETFLHWEIGAQGFVITGGCARDSS